jgi:hypothetical protein
VVDEPRLIGWKTWVPRITRTEWEFRLIPNGTSTRLRSVSNRCSSGTIGFVMLKVQRTRRIARENLATLERSDSVLKAEGVAA